MANPKPTYEAQLTISYGSTNINLSFFTKADAESVKQNLDIAKQSEAWSFNIENGAAVSTIYKLDKIIGTTIIDIVENNELNVRNIAYDKFVEKIFDDARRTAEDELNSDYPRIGI